MSLSIDSSSLYSMYGTDTTSSSTSKLEATLDSNLTTAKDEELMEACKSFETYFVEQVFKEMKKTVQSSDDNEYNEYFGDMLYQEYAKEASEQGNLGIAQMLYESMKR
ncbi:MAG: rod-binding protein [bacterium]|nr:rod-binding protein [bacterium]